MTVYVESNFVIEIVLAQSQAVVAERILEHATRGLVELAVPSIGLYEPISKVMRNGENRRGLMNLVNQELRQIERTPLHSEELEGFRSMAGLFAAIEQREMARLTSILRRIFSVTSIIEADSTVYSTAIELLEKYDAPKKMTDAIICAAILVHLERNLLPGPHYFATKDRKDFSNTDLVERFEELNCKILYSFEECVQRLRIQPSA